MKLLNFRIDGTRLESGYHSFALHDQFTLLNYHYYTQQRRFEIVMQGLVGWPTTEVNHWLNTELTLIFRNVTFLRIQETPFDEQHTCLLKMQFVHELLDQPALVIQIDQLFRSDEIDPGQWPNYLYVCFHSSPEMLIAAETVEVRFHQWNHFDTRTT